MKKSAFFTPLTEDEKIILDEFVAKSKSDPYVGYSPLECAADDENLTAVKFFLKRAKPEDLAYTNSEDKHSKGTNENILDVAMKNPKIFQECLNAVIQHRHLLIPLICSKDVDNDNVLHQIVEFGRLDALKILAEGARDNTEIQVALEAAMTQKNEEGLTPLELARSFNGSTTIERLVSEDILDATKLANAKSNLPAITTVLEDIKLQLDTASKPKL